MNIETAKKQALKIEMASYEELASEYYDASRHPTCANFREASAYLIKNWLEKTDTETLTICEVGAGDSLAAELLDASGNSYKKLYLTDKSPSMLAFSGRRANEKTSLHVCDAADLPFDPGSVDLLISSLGDPYNQPAFWSEARRVLADDGTIIFTTPSHEWSVSFRATENSEIVSAQFELENGQTVSVPSYINSREKQTELLKHSGFEVSQYGGVPLSKLTSAKISPKLVVGSDTYIVEGYLIKKS